MSQEYGEEYHEIYELINQSIYKIEDAINGSELLTQTDIDQFKQHAVDYLKKRLKEVKQ